MGVAWSIDELFESQQIEAMRLLHVRHRRALFGSLGSLGIALPRGEILGFDPLARISRWMGPASELASIRVFPSYDEILKSKRQNSYSLTRFLIAFLFTG